GWCLRSPDRPRRRLAGRGLGGLKHARRTAARRDLARPGGTAHRRPVGRAVGQAAVKTSDAF
ncbi:MAG: hypothetical protein V4755_10815, partial [Curtobacterium sp.]